MLSVNRLSSGYGPMTIVHDVSLTVGAGEIVCLLGANGAGKTTLLRTISGLIPTQGGEVVFDGERLTGLAPERVVRRGLSQVPEGREIFGALTVDQNLRLGAYARRLSADEAAQTRRTVFAYFPVLERKLHLKASALSGGEQQMVAMGRALMSGPRLLLLDEPSLGLSPMMTQSIFEVVRRLRDTGVPILIVEQNANAALALADRGYVLEHGQVAAADSAVALLGDDTIRKNYLGL